LSNRPERAGMTVLDVLVAYAVTLGGVVLGYIARCMWSFAFGRLPAWTCYDVNGEFWKAVVLYLAIAPMVVAIFRPGSRRVLLALALIAAACVPFVWSFTRTSSCAPL
jgi:hypothetical protein